MDFRPYTCEIATTRMRLRPKAESDRAAYIHGLSNRAVARMTSSTPHPLTEAAGNEKFDKGLLQIADGDVLTFAVTTREAPDQFIGEVAFFPDLSGETDLIEIGYWLTDKEKGRGLMTEVVLAALDFAFDKMHLPLVLAGIYLDNPASGRILEKAGFRETARENFWCEARLAETPAATFELTPEAFDKAGRELMRSPA